MNRIRSGQSPALQRRSRGALPAVIGACFACVLALPSQAAPWVGEDFQGNECEGFSGTVGARDYLTRHQPRVAAFLQMTEEHHFNEDVESLTKGMTSEPMGDIDFVLRVFPNHHRALYSAMQYRLKNRKGMPKGATWVKTECYYQRAINFSPRDITTRTQFALLQYKFKKYEDALETYKSVDKLNPDDPLIHYNIGLTLVKLKRFDEARQTAQRVYNEMHFPLPGLRNKLITAGYWTDGTGAETLEQKAAKRQREMDTAAAEESSAEESTVEDVDSSSNDG